MATVFIFLREAVVQDLIPILIQSTLIISGAIFIYIGSQQFLNKKENQGIVGLILVVFILSFSYYVFVDNNIPIRTVIFSATTAIISFLLAQSLLMNKTRSIHHRSQDQQVEEALAQAREGKHILDILMEQIPEGITIADAPDVRIRMVSRYGRELTGKPREVLEGISVDKHSQQWDIYCADGLTPAKNEDLPLTRATQKGELVRDEEWVLGNPSGEHIPILCNAGPIRDNAGNITGGVIVWRDITDRKKAEDALRDARWRLENIIEGTHVGTWEWNVQTGETVFNEVWAQIIGYTLDELAPISIKTWETFVHPDDLKQSAELLERHFAGELSYYDYESRMKHKDGHWVWVHDRGRVITRTGDGKPLMMFGTHTDITDRKRAEEALKESRSQLAEAMVLANLVNWEFDVPSDIFTFNDQFYAMYGTSAEREGGYQMPAEVYAREFVHPDEVFVVAEEVQNAITATDPSYTRRIEHRIIRRDDEIRHIVVQFGITKDTEGRTIKTYGANQDITARKKAEEALRESEERYRSLFENMLDGYAYCRMLYDDQGHPVDFVYLDVKSVFQQLTGLENVIGKPVSEVIPGIRETSPELFESYGRVALTGQPEKF
ncbi:MAG: PAS domain S-box protein, partial [Candidatus Atribacteria bacterium]|nr:PAS domain S-box protein [Candidatus Atribacteria bacterium]